MIMQITAPQAQKRCCFIKISSCPETNMSLCVLKHYSRCSTQLHCQIGQIIAYLDIFSVLARSYPILSPESGGKLTDTAVPHRFCHSFQA